MAPAECEVVVFVTIVRAPEGGWLVEGVEDELVCAYDVCFAVLGPADCDTVTAFCHAECARKTARKFDKNGLLVGISGMRI